MLAMKKLLSLFLFLGLATFTFAQDEAASGASAKFETIEIDYGTIDQGADGVRKFMFTNTGTDPLVIKNARGSCGCTVPTWPKEPVMPGETASIDVKYDTNRVGKFTKTVTLTTNETIGTRMLTIKGNILKKEVETPVPASKPSILKDGE
jgi:hypothetical protein